ncbi:MAG: helix-turn-helix domain-containing protein, partial [Maribacter sp.]
MLFYVFFIFFLLKKKSTSTIFEKLKKKKTLVPSKKNDLLIRELNTIVKDKKLYTDPNLKLLEVAHRLDISAHELSKLINEYLGKNFTDLINEFRIEEAKQLLGGNSLYTVEAIGHQCGFNSKSAFYKAFKKFTHLTPTQYKSQ